MSSPSRDQTPRSHRYCDVVVECTVWWTTPLTDVRRYGVLLSPLERERYDAFRLDADRHRFLTGRALAKIAIAGRLDLPATEIEFDASCTGCGNQHGPPRLAGTDLVFSIAHSGDRIGLALCRGGAIGLDVEATSRQLSDGTLSYTLNETELAAIAGWTASERADAFFVYWARKEALMKATGQGLRLPLRRITLTEPGSPPRLLAGTDATPAPERTRLADLHAGQGYVAALAALGTTELTVCEQWWDPAAEPADLTRAPSSP